MHLFRKSLQNCFNGSVATEITVTGALADLHQSRQLDLAKTAEPTPGLPMKPKRQALRARKRTPGRFSVTLPAVELPAGAISPASVVLGHGSTRGPAAEAYGIGNTLVSGGRNLRASTLAPKHRPVASAREARSQESHPRSFVSFATARAAAWRRRISSG